MNAETLLELIRKATIFDIFLVSFFFLPFVASQWFDILEQLEWSKKMGLGAMLVAYVAGIAIMYYGVNRTKRLETTRDQILQYLNDKNRKVMSFERIRDNINPGYEDFLLLSLPSRFPNDFRHAKLKGEKRGLARLVIEEE